MENGQVNLVAYLSKMRYLVYSAMSVFIVVFFAISTPFTSALTTVPTKMNFQGRLADSAGNIKANGTYNMRLKLFTVSTGGSNVWSEDRLVSATQGVTVTNGIFSIQLGSITTLPASLFASGDLYLEVELPTPGTATSASPTWTEGPMTPRNQMATSAYAYNAETLDGLDSAAFAQLSTSNTFSNANSIQATSTTALLVQSAAGANSFLTVDTSGAQVTIGNAAADGTAVLLRLDDKNTTGDPTGVVGAMYYNSFGGKFRCYQGAAWTDCIGTGGSSTLQNVYTTSTGGTTPEIKLDSTRGGLDIQDADTTIAGSLFTVRAANGAGLGAALFDVTSTGVTTIKNSANSTAAFSIQDSASSVLVNADTTNKRVTVGGGPGTSTARVHTEGQASTAAMSWTARTAAEANSWKSVVYGNGLFVAVSSYGTNDVMTSPDGITWTARTPAEGLGWASVTYGNGLFVAVGDGGTNQVMTSPDGITWTSRAEAEANSWTSVTYGGGQFVAVAYNGTNQAMTSPDGITWTARSAVSGTWTSVTYGNGLFVSVGNGGTDRAMTSADGITWTARTAAETTSWNSVTYGNGLFVAVSEAGTNRVMTSPDGITWTGRSAAEANQWAAVTYANGLFVAVSIDGTNRVMTSPDGITWTARAAAEANQWKAVAYGNGLFVAVANSGTNRVMTSGDVALTTRGAVQVTGGITGTGLVINGSSTMNGSQLIKTATNTTSAFQILNAAGAGLFAVDTTNSRVQIGSATADATGVVLVLDTKNTAGDPTGVAGGMYYNSSLAKFRCYEGTAWRNCSTSVPVNVSTATQAVSAGTDTYLTGSSVPILGGLQGPTSGSQNGTMITWTVTMSKTAAGTAASTFALRVGTNGTTADTARCTNFSTGTATTDVDWAVVTITAYATAGGSTTTLNCSGNLKHAILTGGFTPTATYGVQAYSTAASFDSTPAGTKMGLSFTAGASSVITIQKVEVSVTNL